MKFHNNNNEVIKRITNRSLKTNRTRNIFTIVAISLTTFMLSAVFSIGISFVKNYGIMNLRMQGTTATTSLSNPSDEQLSKIETLDIFNSVGGQINVGNVILENENKGKIKIKYHDTTDWEKQIIPCISDIEGKYPIERNEVMASKKALEFLGVKDPKVGDKLKVTYNRKDDIKEEEFILSGYFINYDFVNDTGYLEVSEEFIKSSDMSMEKDGAIFMTLKNMEKDNAPKLLEEKIQLNKGQQFQFNYDTEKEISSATIITMITIVILGLFIVLSGYLLIYNVMYISVTGDINFYGLLKTIGTSPSQIKKIVKKQALSLSISGISLGLIIGFIVSFVIVPMSMRIFTSGIYVNVMPTEVSFNPIIFIGTAMFSLLTVVLSCRKPAKVASSISPTEALRYLGTSTNQKKKNRNSTNGGKLYKMAWYNVFRDKKRAIVVFLSLFMGIMIFLSVNTFLDSIGVENYIDRYVRNDFELENVHIEKEKMDKNLVEKISNMDGVKESIITKGNVVELDMTDNFFLPLIEDSYKNRGLSEEELNLFLDQIKEDPSVYSSWIIGIDDKLIETYNEESDEKIDLNAFRKGEIALIKPSFYSSKDNEVKFRELDGKIFNLKDNDTGISQSYNTKFFCNTKGILPFGLGGVCGAPTIYISNSMMEKLDKDAANYLLQINVDGKYESEINKKLQEIVNENGFWFESKNNKREACNNTLIGLRILGGGISVILILIGILNFVNVMITGVNVRLKELAVMESIGMTKKQIKKMLTLEGLYYAVITMLLIATLGMGVVYGIAELTKHIADYAEFIFPTVPLIFLTLFILIVCLITPTLVFKVSCKKSVTERIRKIEN